MRSIQALTAMTAAVLIIGCNDTNKAPVQSQAPTDRPVAATAPVMEKSKPQASWDGPFGLKSGLTAAQLGSVIELKREGFNRFISDSSPSPHSTFLSYLYTISEKHGLCSVTAISKAIDTNQFGEQIKSEFGPIEAALIEKYGNPTVELKIPRSGSIWTEDRYWMMGLLKKDRSHQSLWYSKALTDAAKGKPKNDALLPDILQSISLEAMAKSTEEAFLILHYAFNNNDACVVEAQKSKNKNL